MSRPTSASLLHPSCRSGAALLAALLLSIAHASQAEPEADAEPERVILAQAPSQAEEDAAADASETPAGPPPGVEVMRVRGRGLAAIDTEVPASVTQFDAATIEALGAQDISDLSRVTPNVNIIQPGATQSIFFIRGVGLSDFSSNAAGAVSVFQDAVALNAPAIQTGQLFDVEDVGIVRGPQGTGHFRNASAGAIRVRSRRPTGNYTAQLRASLGRYAANGGKGANRARIQDYEGALEFPLVGESLSSRFAFRLREAGPLMTNGCGNAIPFSERLPRPAPGPQAPPLDSRDICGERGNSPFDMWPDRMISQVPEGLPRRVGDQHNWAARGTLRFRPEGSEWDLFLNGHGSRLDQHATLGQAMGSRFIQFAGRVLGGSAVSGYREPDTVEEFNQLCRLSRGQCRNANAGNDLAKSLAEGRPLDLRPFRGDYNRVGQETRDTWGGFVSGEGKVGDLDLFLLASYDAYERFRDQDTDFTPDRAFEQIEEDEAWQTYEEVELKGELEREPLAWGIGGWYLHEVLKVDSDTTIALNTLFDRVYEQTIDSVGVWAEFEWDFLDDFTLGGGVRYNRELKGFDFTREQRLSSVNLPSLSTSQSETWSVPTGSLVLTYHLDEKSSIYAKYSRGYKAGHFNALASQDVDRPPALEEFNDAWEAGMRGSWLDRRLTIAVGTYYYRYENYQVFLFRDEPNSPPVLEIINAKEAESYGVEVEARILPLQGWAPRLIEGLMISGNAAWLHGEYIDFSNTTFQLGPTGTQIPIVVDFSGKQLQNSPEYTLSGTVEWTLDFGRFGSLVPRYDFSWSDDVFFDPNEGRGTVREEAQLPEFAIGQAAYWLHHARLAYRTPTGNVEVAAWVRNIEDRVYKNFAFDVSSFQGLVINFVGDPRTIGIDVTVTF